MVFVFLSFSTRFRAFSYALAGVFLLPTKRTCRCWALKVCCHFLKKSTLIYTIFLRRLECLSSCGFSEVCSNSVVCLFFYTLTGVVFCFQRRENKTDAKNILLACAYLRTLEFLLIFEFSCRRAFTPLRALFVPLTLHKPDALRLSAFRLSASKKDYAGRLTLKTKALRLFIFQ